MLNAFMSSLLELAEKDSNIVYILADSGTNFDPHFSRNFPKRMFDFGIAEQNAVGAAAGMALSGKKPFVFIQGSFIIYRAMEFIRNDICFQNLDVKLIGQGSGIAISSLGPSHHTTEDTAILRTFPNMKVMSPATPNQVKACMKEMAKEEGPCYLKLGMNGEKEFFPEDYALSENGQDVINVKGKQADESGDETDALIFTTGSILEEVMEAADTLSKEGLCLTIVNVVRMKPFDNGNILKYAPAAKKLFTVEEHQVQGGLGGQIAEVLVGFGQNRQLIRIGLEDAFATGYSPDQRQLRKENGLDAGSIAERIRSEFR